MSIFGSYNTMLVIFARDVFENGPQGLGLLQSAPGLGTILGSIALSMIGDVRQKGRLMVAGGVVYGIAVSLFALTRWFPLALVFLALSGAADVVMGATRTTVLQLYSRRGMLGRVMSLHSMSTRGLGPLGGFQAGWLGSLIGVPTAVAIGGAICAAAVLGVAFAVPEVRGFTGEGREEEFAAATGPTDTTIVRR
jgi:MFS family permease